MSLPEHDFLSPCATLIKGTKMIKGDKIILRTIRKYDLDDYYELINNVSAMDIFWPRELKSESDLIKAWERDGLWSKEKGVMLITNHEGKLLGQIHYFQSAWYTPGYELGFHSFTEEMTPCLLEALDLFSNYLFELRPIQRLELPITEGDEKCCVIAEKCGFTCEGIRRQSVYQSGSYRNQKIFSIIRGEEKVFRDLLSE